MAGFSAGPDHTRGYLSGASEAGEAVDAVAFAPYIEFLGDSGGLAAQGLTDMPAAIDGAFVAMRAGVDLALQRTAWHVTLARTYGVTPIDYESGQSASWAYTPAAQQPPISALLYGTLRDPRTADVSQKYTERHQGCRRGPGHVVHCGAYSPWGRWGHREGTVQDCTAVPAPRWDAIVAAAGRYCVVPPMPARPAGGPFTHVTPPPPSPITAA